MTYSIVYKRGVNPEFDSPDELIGYIRGLLETNDKVEIHGLRESIASNRGGIRVTQHSASFQLEVTSSEGLEVAPNHTQMSTWRSENARWKRGAARYVTPSDIQRIDVE